MIDVVKIASYLSQRYLIEFAEQIGEMKLHKLLYFTQRECIIQTGELLFEDRFEAWCYGPVLVKIRYLFKEGLLTEKMSESERKKYKSIFDMVFLTYAGKGAWSLSSVTHGEYSWQHAREGLSAEASCHQLIDNEDIRKDAERVKLRRSMYALLNK